MPPEGLYGRKKMVAYIRRHRIAEASKGSVDRAMRTLGLEGIRRSKGTRTTIPAKDGVRAGDLLNRDFTAPRPDHTWAMDSCLRPVLGRLGLRGEGVIWSVYEGVRGHTDSYDEEVERAAGLTGPGNGR